MAEAGVGFVGCVKRDPFFAIFKFSWSALQTRLGITVGYLHDQGLSHRVRIFDRFCASMSGAHHFLSSLLYVVCILVYQYGGTVKWRAKTNMSKLSGFSQRPVCAKLQDASRCLKLDFDDFAFIEMLHSRGMPRGIWASGAVCSRRLLWASWTCLWPVPSVLCDEKVLLEGSRHSANS